MEMLLLLVLAVLVYVLWGRVKELQTRVAAQEEDLQAFKAGRWGRAVAAPVAPVASKPTEMARPNEAPTPPREQEPEPAVAPAAAPATAVLRDTRIPEPVETTPRSDRVPELPPRSRGLEELIGTRWAVWVGGIALALGAVLLVRYSIEAGLFGPAFRVALGAVLAIGLALAGEWLRRAGSKWPAFPGADVPAILTASATVAAFATTYSAHALYDFLGAGPAFALMGLVGLATLGAAALHGPALAGLGLAASFVTPALVTPGAIPNPWPVVIYLFVVAGAAYALARQKGWTWLSAAAGAGGILWGLMLVSKADDNPMWWPPAMIHTLAQLALAAVALALLERSGDGEIEEERDITATAIFAGFGLLTLGVLVANDGVSPASLVFAGLAIAMLGLVGWSRPGLACVAATAAIVVVTYALLWPGAPLPAARRTSTVVEWVLPLPQLAGGYAVFMGLASAALALLSGERIQRRPNPPLWSATVHAGVAVILPLAVLFIANARLAHSLNSPWGALVAVLLAAVFAATTLFYQDREKTNSEAAIRLGTGAFAAGTVAAVVLALLFALERGYLTMALAGAALATALAAERRRIPVLRSAVGAIGLYVLFRIVKDPLIMGADVGATLVLNWLLLGYAAPALAFFAAARLLEREKSDGNVGLADALALLFGGLLVFMQIRHALHGSNMLTSPPDHAEVGMHAFVAFGGSYALMQLNSLRTNPVFRVGSIILATLAAVSAILTLGLANNPVLLGGETVRGSIWLNTLMPGYLLPGAMAGWLAWNMRAAGRPEWLITLVALVATALVAGFLLLELRYHFHGADMRYLKGAGHVEIGLMLSLLLAVLIALTGIAMLRRTDTVSMVTLTVSALAGLTLLFGLGFNANPLLTGEPVAAPAFVGSLMPAYLLPAIAAALLAWQSREPWPRAFVLVAGAMALVAVFGWLSLSVRQLFQGPSIALLRPTSEMEVWAYSAAWLSMGLLLLGFGMGRGVIEARAASAVFVVATVLKVFLYDLAGLTGFWRAISFIGLGLVLIGIGLVYQRVLPQQQSAGR